MKILYIIGVTTEITRMGLGSEASKPKLRCKKYGDSESEINFAVNMIFAAI